MITKEQWETIEKDLKSLFGRVDFKIDGKKISVIHEFIGENKMAYVIYIDEKITFECANPTKENFEPLVEKTWHKRTRSLYKPGEVKRLTKIWGKRALKRHHPDIDKKIVFYTPWFEKYSVLERQFKKIKELELFQEQNDDK